MQITLQFIGLCFCGSGITTRYLLWSKPRRSLSSPARRESDLLSAAMIPKGGSVPERRASQNVVVWLRWSTRPDDEAVNEALRLVDESPGCRPVLASPVKRVAGWQIGRCTAC